MSRIPYAMGCRGVDVESGEGREAESVEGGASPPPLLDVPAELAVGRSRCELVSFSAIFLTV